MGCLVVSPDLGLCYTLGSTQALDSLWLLVCKVLRVGHLTGLAQIMAYQLLPPKRQECESLDEQKWPGTFPRSFDQTNRMTTYLQNNLRNRDGEGGLNLFPQSTNDFTNRAASELRSRERQKRIRTGKLNRGMGTCAWRLSIDKTAGRFIYFFWKSVSRLQSDGSHCRLFGGSS